MCLCFSAIREISRGRYQGAPFGVPSPLKEGRKLKVQLARRREDESAWLFEILNQEFWNDAATYTASYAGLTRVSIPLRETLSKRMDCRVKPGNDE